MREERRAHDDNGNAPKSRNDITGQVPSETEEEAPAESEAE